MKKRFEIKNWISVIVLAALFVVLGTMSGGKLITPLNIKNLLEQSLPIIIGGAGVIYIIAMGSTDLSIGWYSSGISNRSVYGGKPLWVCLVFPGIDCDRTWNWAVKWYCGQQVQGIILYDNTGDADWIEGFAGCFGLAITLLLHRCDHSIE